MGLALSDRTLLQDFNYLYLHGFASGPASAKALFFAQQFRQLGIQLAVPDLNQPSFQEMTITSILSFLEAKIAKLDNKNLVIIGSSMGGLLATMIAKKYPSTRALVLMAPGFGIGKRWRNLLGKSGQAELKESGSVNVYHYACQRELPLRKEFFLDLNRYETDNLSVGIPTLIFHGLKDKTVPITQSRRFQDRNCRCVHLAELDDDHSLLSSLSLMWNEAERFLSGLPVACA